MWLEEKNKQLFKSTANGLCIGLRYEFSAYLASVVKESSVSGLLPKPNVRFEVQASTRTNNLPAQCHTGDIPHYASMTWTKYAVSFNVSSSSVVLLLISQPQRLFGYSVAIDDIRLRVCSTDCSDLCRPG